MGDFIVAMPRGKDNAYLLLRNHACDCLLNYQHCRIESQPIDARYLLYQNRHYMEAYGGSLNRNYVVFLFFFLA